MPNVLAGRRRKFILTFLGLTWLLIGPACANPAAEEALKDVGPTSAPLLGVVTDDMTSRALNLSTPAGIAGTVGALEFKGTVVTPEGPKDRDWDKTCSVTLVARDKVLTAKHCFATGPVILPGHSEYRVNFPQEPSVYFEAIKIEMNPAPLFPRGGDLAVLTLRDQVPATIVANVSPLFTGNLDFWLARGPLLGLVAENSVVVGLGGPAAIRRWGTAWNLSRFTDQYGPAFRGDRSFNRGGHLEGGDSGGPLFFWNRHTQTYVLVGVASGYERTVGNSDCLKIHSSQYCDVIFAVDEWTAIGSVGHLLSPNLDNSAWLCDKLGRGSGEPCDDCLGFQGGFGPNSNSHAERALGVYPRADKCDPIPIMRFVERDIEPADPANGQVSDGVGPNEALAFRAQSMMGRGAYDDLYEGTYGFRYCACYDSRGPLPEEDCVETACDPAEASMAEAFESWTEVSVDLIEADGSSVIVPSTGGPYEDFEKSEMLDEKPGAERDFLWRWFDDASNGRIASTFDSGSGYRTTQGMLASTVFGAAASAREFDLSESAVGGAYGPNAGRAVLEFRQMAKLAGVPLDDLPDVPSRRRRWDLPFDGLTNRGQLLVNNSLPKISRNEPWVALEPFLTEWIRSPALVDPGDGALRVFTGGSFLVDLGPKNCDDLRRLIGHASELTFLDPVEPRGLLDRESSVAAIVAFGSSASPGGWLINSSATGRCIQGRDPVFSPLSTTSDGSLPAVGASDVSLMTIMGQSWFGDGPPLRVPALGQAAFSAAEQSVYLVGGNDPGENGAIRRYDLTNQSVESKHPAVFAPAPTVLGVGYDPFRRSLFVLDVTKDVNANHVARIVRHDLELGRSVLLREVPFDGDYYIFSLDVTEGGREIVLMAGAELGFSAWRIDAATGRVLGSYSEGGVVLEKPSMGEYDLFLSIWKNDGLVYRSLPASRFTGEAPCDRL